jgi:hypothetical protein
MTTTLSRLLTVPSSFVTTNDSHSIHLHRGRRMTLLETLEYFLTETAADMDGLSWEIREETNYEANNVDGLSEIYDFNKSLYDNLKQIKSIIEQVKVKND